MPLIDVLQMLAIPLALALSHALLAVVVIQRHGPRGRDVLSFTAYILLSTGSLLLIPRSGPQAIWPHIAWRQIAAYLLISSGMAFWTFTCALLKRRNPIVGWAPGMIVVLFLAMLHAQVITLPVGDENLVPQILSPLAGALTAAGYVIAAIITAAIEFRQRASPLHRNRIVYLLLGTAILVAGLTMVFVATHQGVELIGASVHWLGVALLGYVTIQPHLPNVATGLRQALSYLLSSLLPALVIFGLSLGVAYGLGRSTLPELQVTSNVALGVAIGAMVTFLLFQPLSSLTRLGANRWLFGPTHRGEAVIREYSRAITQTLSLKELVQAAMQTINRALGVQRGTLLVVDESRQGEWELRVVQGLDVPGGQPPLVLQTGTPLARWLVDRGAPLHQYTLDVDAQFATLDAVDREAWQRLNMEIYFPIKRSGNLIGILALGLRRSGRPYTHQELDLLAALADQTAVALENASLFDRVQRRVEQLALLNEIGRAITSSLDLESAVDLIAERLESAFEGAAGFIFLLREREGDLALRRSFGTRTDKPELPIVRPRQGLVGWVVAEGQSVFVPALSADSRYAVDVEGSLAPDARVGLCVPIISRTKTIGAILVAAPSQAGLGLAELNLLDSIASFASIAIENARQVEAREARLRKQVEELRIEIDEIKRSKHVAEITDTDYFRQLRSQAQQMREERESDRRKKGMFGAIQDRLDEQEDDDQDDQ